MSKIKENSSLRQWVGKKIRKELIETTYYKKIKANLNYRDAKGYVSIKDLVFDMALHLHLMVNSNLPIDDCFQALLIHSLDFVYRELVPCYWVKEDLVTALLNTEIPKHWIEIKPFVPKGIFLFPKGLIKNPDGLSLNWLFFQWVPAGYERQPLVVGEKLNISIDVPRSNAIVWATKLKDDAIYASNLLLEPDDLGNPKYAKLEITEAVETYTELSPIEEEEAFVNSVEKLCFQLMLYMMARPDSIAVQSGFGKTRGTSKNDRLRDPVWLGKNFKLKRQEEAKDYNKGIGAAKMTHWRRGHWREQQIGERSNPQHKTIWIEPVLVNG